MEKKLKKIVTSLSIVVLMLVLALISLGPGGITGAFAADAQIGSDIVTAFDQGKEEVSVIVLLKDSDPTIRDEEEQKEAIKEKQEEVLADLHQEEYKTVFGFTEEKEFELKHQYETLNALAGEVTEEGLDKLRNDPNVETIVVNKVRQIFLSGSVPVINADDVWNVVVNGYNITGTGETVCVVDTGIDYNHTSLNSNYAAGYDFYNNDSDPMDDQGHGTHVAGIIASVDGTYRGIAPGAKIAAMKVCSSSGSCPDADVLAGMDWCISNKDLYNISVISISLGGGQYTSYCDGEVDFAPYAAAINDAVSRNISVVAATGNSGAGNMAGPACVQNATRVTATTKSDTMPSYASRHAFFTDTIAAPGSAITSLNDGGGVVTMSGTSMATPHLSGAFALIRQYWKQAYGKIPTSEQLEQKVLSSGNSIYDPSTGINYVRVDVLAALQPTLSLVNAPQNLSILNYTEVTITLLSDVDLAQAWLQWTYQNGTVQNLTLSTSSNASSTEFSSSLTNLSKGQHSYQVYGTDAGGMTGAIALQLFIIDNIPPAISLLAPTANNTLDAELYNFTAEIDDEHSSLSAVWFNLSDGNNSFQYFALQNSTLNSSDAANSSNNIWISQVNLSELANRAYTVTVHANDSFGNENETEVVSFTIGQLPVGTFLNVYLIKPVAGDIYKTEVVALNVTINSSVNVSDVIFNITNAAENVSILALHDNSSAWTAWLNMSTLAEGNHTVAVIAQDVLGNVNDTVSVQFTVDRTAPLLNTITESNLNESSIKMQWSTDEAADAKVQYGTSAALGTETVALGNDTTTHELTLLNLAASTLYYYSVASCDAVDNCNISELRNFTTIAAPQPAPDEDAEEENSDENDSNDDSSSDSGSSAGSSSSGSGSSGGGGGDSSSSSSSSSDSEELAEAETEVVEEAPEEELQIAAQEGSSAEESKVEEQQTAEQELTIASDGSDDENKGFGNLLTGFVSAAVLGDLSSKEYLLVGLTALVVVLTIAFIVIRKRANEF